MKTPRRQFGLTLAMSAGLILAVVLSVQCVRTYSYVDRVLVPREAQLEANREAGVLLSAAREAGVTDAAALGPVLARLVEGAADRVLWMRVLDRDGKILCEAGKPLGDVRIPPRWWQQAERYEDSGQLISTPGGRALVTLLALRLGRGRPASGEADTNTPGRAVQGNRRAFASVLQVAVSLDAMAGSFSALRQNLLLGLCASIALIISMVATGLRARVYLRGKYLESEMQLARRVQADLLPNARSVFPQMEYAASAIAADHVGGDFYDLFTAGEGAVGIVLGDVSGKGIPASLLASVVQGAVRSASAERHEMACSRINAMLCERSEARQFASLFWAVFDPRTFTLRYVNAGHGAPLLVRAESGGVDKLDEGGPVLGLLPNATWTAGTVMAQPGDTLLVYSDGISEASNAKGEEFGDDRVLATGKAMKANSPALINRRIMEDVASFSQSGTALDDRTLLVIRFSARQASI